MNAALTRSRYPVLRYSTLPHPPTVVRNIVTILQSAFPLSVCLRGLPFRLLGSSLVLLVPHTCAPLMSTNEYPYTSPYLICIANAAFRLHEKNQ